MPDIEPITTDDISFIIDSSEPLLSKHIQSIVPGKKDKIYLYENPKESVKETDAIYIRHLRGFFLNTDKRISNDYLTNDFIIVDPDNYKLHSVYKVINKKVIVVGYTSVITTAPNNIDIYYKTKKIIPLYEFDGTLSYLYAGDYNKKLIKNILFEDKFGNLHIDKNSSFFKKLSLTNTNKIRGRKHKNMYSYSDTIKGLPITYTSTFGKKYKFGIEIETSSGVLPMHLDSNLFYDAVYDGSLKHDDDGEAYGLEYVTDVLEGDLGMNQFKKLVNELAKRCKINKKCGVHVHLSKIDFSKENLVLMYLLYRNLEKEIFDILPQSRRKNVYCRKLTNLGFSLKELNLDYKYYIDVYYNELVAYISKKGYSSVHINKKLDHPAGFKCGYDHSSARYCWVNFVPAMFNTRKNGIYTIEFRPMSASLSYSKIKAWLLICMALVSVVENNKADILKGNVNTLEDVIKLSYPNNYRHLLAFVESRKEKFEGGIEDSKLNEDVDYEENEIYEKISIKEL